MMGGAAGVDDLDPSSTRREPLRCGRRGPVGRPGRRPGPTWGCRCRGGRSPLSCQARASRSPRSFPDQALHLPWPARGSRRGPIRFWSRRASRKRLAVSRAAPRTSASTPSVPILTLTPAAIISGKRPICERPKPPVRAACGQRMAYFPRRNQQFELGAVDVGQMGEAEMGTKDADVGQMLQRATAVFRHEPFRIRGARAHVGGDAQAMLVGEARGGPPNVVGIGRVADQDRPGGKPRARLVGVAGDLGFELGDGGGGDLGLIGGGIVGAALDPFADPAADAGGGQGLHGGIKVADGAGLQEGGGPAAHHRQGGALGRQGLIGRGLGAEDRNHPALQPLGRADVGAAARETAGQGVAGDSRGRRRSRG